MIMALALSFSANVLAFDVSEEKNTLGEELILQDLGEALVTPELQEMVNYDLAIIDKVISTDNIRLIELKNNKPTYEKEFKGGIKNTISISEDENGNVIMSVTENKCHDEIIFMVDGRIFIDGNEITSAKTEEEQPKLRSMGFMRDFYTTSPITPESGYDFSNPYLNSNPTVSLGNKVKDVTTTGFCIALFNGLKGLLSMSNWYSGTDAVKAMLDASASDLLIQAKRFAPDSTYGSVKVRRATHTKSNGLEYFYKYEAIYNSKEHFWGTDSDSVYFYENKWSY